MIGSTGLGRSHACHCSDKDVELYKHMMSTAEEQTKFTDTVAKCMTDAKYHIFSYKYHVDKCMSQATNISSRCCGCTFDETMCAYKQCYYGKSTWAKEHPKECADCVVEKCQPKFMTCMGIDDPQPTSASLRRELPSFSDGLYQISHTRLTAEQKVRQEEAQQQLAEAFTKRCYEITAVRNQGEDNMPRECEGPGEDNMPLSITE